MDDTVSHITGKSIGKTYEKKSLHEKILHAPDSYIGSIEKTCEPMWVRNPETQRIELREITFVEGFFKIFDEVLVNAIDQVRRLRDIQEKQPTQKIQHVKNIYVSIDRTNGWITVENDGEGIDIVQHPEHKMYVPELIFSQLLTSTNYDNSVERTVGGKNGYGAKLANIFSQTFHLETVDRSRKLRYLQTCSDNMYQVNKPVIEKWSKKPYTKISYLPDFERFGIHPSTCQDWDILERRVYDACACTPKDVNVWLNGTKIQTKSFEQYVELYLGPKKDCPRIFFSPNERWEVGFCLSEEGESRQVSFVNGIFTDMGGTHVNHIMDTMSKKIAEEISSKSKQVTIKPEHVRRNLWVFVKSVIVNPSFDGQTKRRLTSQSMKFGSRCFPQKPKQEEKEKIQDLVKQVIRKLGLAQRVKKLSDFVNATKLEKTKGSHTGTVNVPKLVDAHFAGKSKSSECTLVLTEGDSAKSSAQDGLTSLDDMDRRRYGLFPLRGKLLNVREASVKQLAENEEIIHIIKILGLRYGTDYSKEDNFKKLRYGRVMILTDADYDGEHIKGLIMNFFHWNWPSLLKRKGFICGMVTPIVKAKRMQGKRTIEVKNFYSEQDYLAWTQANPMESKRYDIKYYKGLGSSTSREAKDWFREMKVVHYTWDEITQTSERGHLSENDSALELAFKSGRGKEMSNRRKEWLKEFTQRKKRDDPLDDTPIEDDVPPFRPEESYFQFIHERFVHFSNYDNIRSLPNVCDGFKPSMRKVLYTTLSRNLKKVIKVSQLGGSVSEISAYHHGETSLYGTIIGMAKNYPGSNNINLLYPDGQFGSRRMKHDSASPRYIFTCLEEITPYLFDSRDQPILQYQRDDGKRVEPTFYVPILPMVLINGAHGIGTGFSTDVPMYNPRDIIKNIYQMFDGNEPDEMIPWYRGFKGTVMKDTSQEGLYIVRGVWEYGDSINEIIITEIPLGYSSADSLEDYLSHLERLKGDGQRKRKSKRRKQTNEETSSTSLDEGGENEQQQKEKEGLISKIEADTNDQYNFRIHIWLNPTIADEIKEEDLEKKLGLRHSISIRNMYLFDAHGEIKRYSTAEDILNEFYHIRIETYRKRKEYTLRHLTHQLNLATNKRRFIEDNADEIKIYRKTKEEKYRILEEGGYDKIAPWNSNQEPNYTYLLSIRIDDFSNDKVKELEQEITRLEDTITTLESATPQSLWRQDLEQLETIYDKHEKEWKESVMEDDDILSNISKKRRKGKSSRSRK